VRATVLIPTHDHGSTLLRSVPSALAQTVADLEVFVVGDGVPDETREIVAELARDDERIRFFDNAKGPRHGELHRHAALAEARGEIVCYLSDDDLYTAAHVETMLGLLDGRDFANTLPVWVQTDGSLAGTIVDLELPFYRELLLSGENRIPLSCAAHSLAFYRRLPHGWRTTPAGTFTDLYMFQQILAAPGVRAVSSLQATVWHFPSPARPGWSLSRRNAELDRHARMTCQDLQAGVATALVGAGLGLDFRRKHAEDRLQEHEARVAELQTAHAQASERAESLQKALEALRVDHEALAAWAAHLQRRCLELERGGDRAARERERLQAEAAALAAHVDAISASATWRLGRQVAALPVAGPLVRAAARARARRRAL
jgi:GalNAc5-diNAcBac-PP-undecaprenol beta-1,3-glucosyltransferase